MWSVIVGPLIGLGGSVLTKWLDQRHEKTNLEHELAMKKADAEIMAQEWANKAKLADVAEASRADVAAGESFSVALKTEAARYSSGIRPTPVQAWLMYILDFVRGMVRPGLTLYLCAITSVVAWQAYDMAGHVSFDPIEATGMLKTIIDRVLFLTETVVMFWFGIRTKSR